MTKPKPKGALALARALNRYDTMENPAEARNALHREWPPVIVDLVDPILWSMVGQFTATGKIRKVRKP